MNGLLLSFSTFFSIDSLGDLDGKSLESLDVSEVCSLVIGHLLLDILLVLYNTSCQVLDVVVDLSCLFTDSLLHVLDEPRPFVASVTLFDVGGEEEAISSLLKKTKTTHNDLVLVVENTPLSILKLNL